MKKSLIVLAALGAFAGVASAQSSVTLFGVVDVGARYQKDGATSLKTVSTDGLTTSRLGFKGVEDLGGGLKAGFHLEASLGADVGSAGTTDKQADKLTRFWHRRSTVSLLGGFGEVRLGRDFAPTYTGWADYDAFSTAGVGDLTTVFSKLGSASYDTQARTDNAVSYLTPATLGGFYGQLSVAPGEGVDGKKYVGGRLGFANGPLSTSLSYGQTEVSAATGDKFKVGSLGASYDLRVVKLFASATQNKLLSAKQNVYSAGVHIPVGSGKVRFQYAFADDKTASNKDASKLAVGYVHSLSKRTELYTTVAQIINKNGANYQVASSTLAAPTSTDNKSRGVEFGLKHSF